MPVLRPTPVLAPLALCSLAIFVLILSCSVDHRRLREDASGGCSSAEMSNCEAESGGVVTSRSTGGTPSTGAGGTSSEAGQGVGARDGGAGDSGAGSEASTGAPCSSDDECRAPEAGVAQCLTDWPGGYYCPCHNSRFDLAARVFKGSPAPTNMTVPPHRYASDTVVVIGEDTKGA